MRFSDYIDPVLISFLLKGKLRPRIKIQLTENGNIYAHFDFCLKWRKSVLAVNIVALLIGD
jgi:Cu(I)/Ag(I) efflux system membrane protein CusA/SilA